MALKISSDFSAMANSTLTQLHKHQSAMGKSIERVSTGYKINSASDGSLKYYLANRFDMKAEEQNATNEAMQTGSGFLNTADKALSSILDNLKKMREQMYAIENGQVQYGGDEYKQIKSDFNDYKNDIGSIIALTKFNGNNVLTMTGTSAVTAQVVVDATNGWTNKFTINNLSNIFGDESWGVAVNTGASAIWNTGGIDGLTTDADKNASFAALAAAFNKGFLTSAINTITSMQGRIGTALERVNTATNYLDDLAEININSRDTIKNADMAKEMTEYVKQNVLAQASQAMLSQANSGLASVLNLLS